MALFKGSRYQQVPTFSPNEAGKIPFRGLRPRPIGQPETVLEHAIALKDRLDALGYNFYNRPNDWYLIAEANPDWLFPEDILHILEPTPSNGDADTVEALEKDSGTERVGSTILIARKGPPQ